MEKHELIKEVLYSKEDLENRIVELAEELNEYYLDIIKKDPDAIIVVVGILKGSVPFMAELIKHFKFDFIADFMLVSSYMGKTKSTTIPKLILDLNTQLVGKYALIVEDILESGTTIQFVKTHMQQGEPKEVKTAVLMRRVQNEPRYKNIDAEFVGFEVAEDQFLVGYGFDIEERLRNLPYIGSLDKAKWKKWKWNK
ncbi:hypoxanthine phosphoribosyltransferase [Spiroplasma endosymbiont of Crioceris asparagi]|uniref:hypoxanthine phosphoribosyltransferase n=1 Tax=Spiroplasma endosymbiont of Crioceris asparagi TaxID=3066286 RepID=UPI0030D49018